MNKNLKRALPFAGLAVAIAAVGGTAVSVGGFSVGSRVENSQSEQSITLFSLQQISAIEGRGANQTEMIQAGTSDVTSSMTDGSISSSFEPSATVLLNVTGILPNTIDADPDGLMDRTTVFKLKNRSNVPGVLAFVDQNYLQSHANGDGSRDFSATRAGDLVNLTVTNAGPDGIIESADDSIVFTGSLNEFTAGTGLSTVDFPVGATRLLTFKATSVAQDRVADMGYRIDNLDIRFALTQK